MNASVCPMCFPAIQIDLRIFQAFETQPFERCLLRVTDTRFDLAFAIRVSHPAWKRCDAVMLEHVTVQRIERGIVDVGREHALAQIVEHHYARCSTQSAKCFLMQLSPDARTGAEHQEAKSFSAISERHHEQSCSPVLAPSRIAHPSPRAVPTLC